MSLFRENKVLFKEKVDTDTPFWRNVPLEKSSCGLGFVVTQEATREAIDLALRGLCGMRDRTGEAFGAGDGAGIMLETAGLRGFIESFLPEGKNVPREETLSIGMFFFEPELGENPRHQKKRVESIMKSHGVHVHGWRKVPANYDSLPDHVKPRMHCRWQLIYSPGDKKMSKNLYRKNLFYAQQRIEREIKGAYPVSLNPDTTVYKAYCTPGQFKQIYKDDLDDPHFVANQVSFHARMSTNTEGTEPNAQPFRLVAHNGELVSNPAQSSAQADLERRLGVSAEGEDCVTVSRRMSDSSHIDGMFQVLMVHDVRGPEAVRRRMLPARDDRRLYPEKIQEFHGLIERTQGPMAIAQGPAAIVVMTGHRVTVAMDPLNLRSFVIYGDDETVIGSSEVGSPPVSLEKLKFVRPIRAGEIAVVERGKLITPEIVEARMAENSRLNIRGNPRVFTLDFKASEILDNEESAENFSREQLIAEWNHVGGDQHCMEAIRYILEHGKEKVEGMGDDRPLAIMSCAKLRTAAYFSQIGGVVTDPPMDALREGGAISLQQYFGRSPKQLDSDDPDSFEVTPEFLAASPILNPAEFQELVKGTILANGDKPKHIIVDCSVDGTDGAAIKKRLDGIITEVVDVAEDGRMPIVIFSDRQCREKNCLFVPPVFIASAVNYQLRQKGLRDNVKLVFDTMDCLEAHDMALLISQGADGVNPYLVWELAMSEAVQVLDYSGNNLSMRQRLENMERSLSVSLKKVMAKHGVIHLNAYKGACFFEALGIDAEISREYLPYNPSRIGGLTFDDFARDQIERIKEDRREFRKIKEASSRKGQIKKFLNQIAESGWEGRDAKNIYQLLVSYIEMQRDPVFLRDLVEFKYANERGVNPLSVDEVESVGSIICRHFRGAHMSDGAISPVAHAAIAAAVNELAEQYMPQIRDEAAAWASELGLKPVGYSKRLSDRPTSGSGEGGESYSRYPGQPLEKALSHSKQIASGRFGVNAYYLVSVGDDGELNIKIGQGAKPYEGGLYPANKNDQRIANQRGVVPGIELASPPCQHDLYSIEDLMRLIWDLRAVYPEVRTVSVKVTTKPGIGTIAMGVFKSGADKVTLSGHGGGTAAAALSSTRYTGSPLELGIVEAFSLLKRAGFVDKIRLEGDGGIITGMDVVKLAILGLDEFGFGTSLLQGGEGCIFCNDCNGEKRSCPVGICTTDAEAIARLGLGAKAEKYFENGGTPIPFVQQYLKCKNAVKHYWLLVADHVRQILANLGVRTLEELRGRYDLLKRVSKSPESDRVDMGFLWQNMVRDEDVPNFGDLAINKKEAVNKVNRMMVDAVRDYIGDGPLEIEINLPGVPDSNVDEDLSRRTIGGTLAGMVARGLIKLPANGVKFRFKGYTGQTFGFMNIPGVTLEVEGLARDFVGEGMCGGKIVVRRPDFWKENKDIEMGGASHCYGATGGEAYFEYKVGQRFGVRNSGATLVCEGAGKYAFEFMTGGVGVSLGETGPEVGTGMGGGELFLLNTESLDGNLNNEYVKEVGLDGPDEEKLRAILVDYFKDTGSLKAGEILDDWDNKKQLFVKVVAKKEPVIKEVSSEGRKRLNVMQGQGAERFAMLEIVVA